MKDTVGIDLRHARERARLSLADLSARTKIRVALLEAIEREQFDRLPAGLLTRGYLRAYAREVGLDSEAVVRQYIEEFEPERLPPAPRPEPPDTEWDPEPPVRTRWAIFAPVIPLTLAALFFVMVMDRPAEIAPPLPLPPTAATPVGTQGEEPAEASVTETAADTVATTTGRLRIDIHPTGLTWVEASVDGNRVLYELVDAGQRRTLEAKNEIALVVGDSGAFAYSINDSPGRALGGPSEVRAVRITRDTIDSFLVRGQ